MRVGVQVSAFVGVCLVAACGSSTETDPVETVTTDEPVVELGDELTEDQLVPGMFESYECEDGSTFYVFDQETDIHLHGYIGEKIARVETDEALDALIDECRG